jgi:hypothetical protein
MPATGSFGSGSAEPSRVQRHRATSMGGYRDTAVRIEGGTGAPRYGFYARWSGRATLATWRQSHPCREAAPPGMKTYGRTMRAGGQEYFRESARATQDTERRRDRATNTARAPRQERFASRSRVLRERPVPATCTLRFVGTSRQSIVTSVPIGLYA